MKKDIVLGLLAVLMMCTSCASLYVSSNPMYADGIYYSGSTKVVVAESQDVTIVEPWSADVISGYWLGGWSGSNAELRQAYTIIERYPSGFGYITDGAAVADALAFSPEWNVFVSGNRYWWFPTSYNFAMYNDFMFGIYPSAALLVYDYSPFSWYILPSVYYPSLYFGWNTFAGWNFGLIWGSYYYDPWWYGSYSWRYSSPWRWYGRHYTSTRYNPWNGHFYHNSRPSYGHSGSRPGGHTPSRPNNVGPQRPNGQNGSNNTNRTRDNRWSTSSSNGGTVVRPSSVQRSSTGGGVSGSGNSNSSSSNRNVTRPSTSTNSGTSTTSSRNSGTTTTTTRTPGSSTTTRTTSGTTLRSNTGTSPGNTSSINSRSAGGYNTGTTTRTTGTTTRSTGTTTRSSGTTSHSTSVSRPSSGGGGVSRSSGGGASRSSGGGGGASRGGGGGRR